MTSKVQPGWAVRRKHQCKSTENSRPTWADWVVCCPSQTKWAPIGNTTQCVIEDTKEEVPTQCADPTLVLWKNRDYFCCEPGLIGFENYWKSVGCADVDEVSAGIENRTMKNVEQLGIIPSNSTDSNSSTSISTPSSLPSISSATSEASGSSGSSPSGGVIAGAVVGSVAGLILIVALVWFLARRHYRSKDLSTPQGPFSGHGNFAESSSKHRSSELDATDPRLQGSSIHSPARNELPANPPGQAE
ncbi:hypothetical protein MYU51_011881 [Penicillium brevicompactum]|uniref:uncharacterized protein n=1 Tax=Penicillium brevicompactum TaxID=5074 RepID=UPI002541F8EA|nr:uncharacterized protein N7506_002327 [Penicillium brevicompactum]KAJ5349074.1 hypothetical protein N7506_002327 [Penicillium brevicompactum]